MVRLSTVSSIDPYAKIICFSVLPTFLSTVDTIFLQSTSKASNLIKLRLFATGFNLGISYILIYGKLGFPALGLLGSGYTSLIQSWLYCLILKFYLYKNEDFKEYGFFKFNYFSLNKLKKIIKLGIPLYLLSLGDQAGNFINNIMLGWSGTSQVAINQIAITYIQFISPPIHGIRQATQIYIAQFNGRKDYLNIKNFGNIGIFLEASLNLFPLLAFSIFPYQLANFFIKREDFLDFEDFVRIAFITKALEKILKGIQNSTSENLRSLFDTYYPSIIQLLITYSIVLPLSYFMGVVLDWKSTGINAAACVGAIITMLPLLDRWKKFNNTTDVTDNTIEQVITPMYNKITSIALEPLVTSNVNSKDFSIETFRDLGMDRTDFMRESTLTMYNHSIRQHKPLIQEINKEVEIDVRCEGEKPKAEPRRPPVAAEFFSRWGK